MQDHTLLLTSLQGGKKLHTGLVEHFVVDKKLNPQRIRGVFMQAGIVSPRSDELEELIIAIKTNVVFLNVYAAKNSSFKKKKSPRRKAKF